MIRFSELPLRAEILAAIASQNYETATPIQEQAIPPALAGRDILGIAQTGTGKTAAFTLPILERLSAPRDGKPVVGRPGEIRALILTPTRELAIQINDSIAAYGAGLRLRHAVIFGGVGQKPQVDALLRGLDILVATPGRLIDLMNQGHVRLDRLEVFVLDEADRMLDMGFIHDVKRVVAKLPKQRQSLFFSATMPNEVADLAGRLLREPVRVEVTPVATTAEKIEQSVVFVPAAGKRQLLIDMLRADPSMHRIIVFTRTKHGANKVAQYLEKAAIPAAAIHGNKSQNARQAALEGFRAGSVRVLVATDIAARGIDIDGVSHVVNFELPNIPESYVHRIGRTARASASGVAIAFCDDGEERVYLRDIEKLTRTPIKVIERALLGSTGAMEVEIEASRPRQAAPAAKNPPSKNPPAKSPPGTRNPRRPTKASTPVAAEGDRRRPPSPKEAEQQRSRVKAPGGRPASAFGDLVAAINGAGPDHHRPPSHSNRTRRSSDR